MTIAAAPAPTLPPAGARRGPLRLIRSELLKIRTINAWWWFALGTLAWTLIAMAFNMWFAYTAFEEPELVTGADTSPAFHGANVYTSGQFLGLMLVMLLGIIIVTNEFFHQTATVTFLITPHRTTVIVNKLATAALISVVFWAVTTVFAVGGGALFFSTQDHGLLLGEWAVQRAILLNLVAFAIWGIFGVAIGTLINSQLAATIIAAVAYLVGTQVAALLFLLLSNLFDNESIMDWQVVIPSVASSVMTTGSGDADGGLAWWVGALVLLGYAVVAGAVGILITRRRDIS